MGLQRCRAALARSIDRGSQCRQASPANHFKRFTDGDALTHNVLFVCGKNRMRSPTAEHVFADWPGVETASAGIGRDADCPMSAELIRWADIVLVMEATHRTRIAGKFKAELRDKRVVVLGIPDEFDYMDPELVRLLQQKVPPYLPGRSDAA